MSDTISRQAAIEALKRAEALTRAFGYHVVIDTIREVPSAQPERCEDCRNFNKARLLIPQPERKKGKWIYHSEIGWGDTWLCDQCGEKTTSTVMGKPRANYCPMCGADMRGEQDG